MKFLETLGFEFMDKGVIFPPVWLDKVAIVLLIVSIIMLFLAIKDVVAGKRSPS